MITSMIVLRLTDAALAGVVYSSDRLDTYADTAKALGASLQHYYLTLGEFNGVLVVETPDEQTAAQLALAITAQGQARAQVVRAYAAHEFAALAESMRAGVPHQVGTLESLRRTAADRQLVEHISDSASVRLRNYPTALTISEPQSSDAGADISLGMGQQSQLRFADDIYAVGFTYQQGLNSSTFSVALADGSTHDFYGQTFMPDSAFFGFASPQPIVSLIITGGGQFLLRSCFFFAQHRYERQFEH